MVDLPRKKVGIVACSGEELPEGTVTRLAALQVLEELRPADTVTICLPLFLAGGEGDRAFARFYPTIALDGCEQRCAARATEMYSGKPAASLVVTELVADESLLPLEGRRRLNESGRQAVARTAAHLAEQVDELLGQSWDRRAGENKIQGEPARIEIPVRQAEAGTTCVCGSGIPVQIIVISNEAISLVGLPLIFQQFHQAGKVPGDTTSREVLETVKIYNPVPPEAEAEYREALGHAYQVYCQVEGVSK